jgi:hypothetical protein
MARAGAASGRPVELEPTSLVGAGAGHGPHRPAVNDKSNRALAGKGMDGRAHQSALGQDPLVSRRTGNAALEFRVEYLDAVTVTNLPWSDADAYNINNLRANVARLINRLYTSRLTP